MTKTLSWSWSAIKVWMDCPKRYWYTKVDKSVKDPPSKSMADGDEIHKSIQFYLQHGKPLVERVQFLQPVLDALRSKSGTLIAERSVTLRRDMRETTWDDWTNAWVRCKLDVVLLSNDGKKAAVIDWKTGKIKQDERQLQLCALVLFALYPGLEQVQAQYYWLDIPNQSGQWGEAVVVTRHDIDRLWCHFNDVVAERDACHLENVWNATPGRHCRWCPAKDVCADASK